jgi:multidrug efflux pump subunit AcrA (membrane-fusion protein)
MKLRQDEPEPGTLDVESDGSDGRVSRRPGPPRESAPDGRRTLATRFREQPVLNSLLVLACIVLIILAYTAVGPSSSTSSATTRTSTAKYGVVQSTVSGSGNIESADQLNLGFKTSGTVTHIDVKQGQHVNQGQLLATLDPQSAEVSLEQAKASLQSAEADLAKLEETEGETTGSQGSSGTGASASTASTGTVENTTEEVAPTSDTTGPSGEATPNTETGTSTTPASTAPTSSTKHSSGSDKSSSSEDSKGATQSTGATTESTPSSDSGSSTTTKQSAATREANLASAKAAVKSDKLSVQSAEQAVGNTRLYAPESGTIVTLSGEVGETVSGTGTSKASSSSGSSSTASSSTGTAATGKSSTGAAATGTGASSTGGSSSSSFAVLNNLESLQLVVGLSESEIGNVHEGQIATVTIEALDRKVAAHVASVGQVPTSSSGAVSYDVTFQLDQGAEGLKVGMSATAEVVVHQAEGVNVPTSAIKADTVTVVRDGKHVTQSVTTGLAGNSSTIILSGLRAGEEVVLPTLSTSSSTSLTSKIASRLGRGGGGLSVGVGGGGGIGGGGGGFAGGGPP